MATIRINHLHLRAIIGTHPWERTNKQDLIAHITIDYDASKAAQSDHLKDALNYEAIALKVTKIVEQSRYQLLEKLAGQILKTLMADKRIQRAVVTLDKPLAISLAKCVSYEVSESR